jgi:hypothetical protein
MLVILDAGNRDQEDHSSKPAQANSSQNPISKNLITHTQSGAGEVVGGGRCRP